MLGQRHPYKSRLGPRLPKHGIRFLHPNGSRWAMAHKDIVVIGGSAGALQVFQDILSALPWDFQPAIFLILHTTEDSPRLLPDILNRHSKLPVMYAVHNAPILPSRVYIAPAGQRHMLLDRGK